MKISIGNDHAGVAYKNAIQELLRERGVEVYNHGTDEESSVDYPDFAHLVAKDVAHNKVDFGIVICGSGNGVAMTVNKYQNIRGALCWNREIVELAREHNNANILCIPARYTAIEQVKNMVEVFLDTVFDDGGRHERRVEKISCI